MPQALFIHSTQTISLSTQLHQFSEEKSQKSHLIITQMLSQEELAELGLFINEPEFSFAKIRLEVNRELLEKERFLNVLQQLNHVSPRGVTLVFPVEEIRHLGDELVKLLIARIAPDVFYPLYIQQRDGHEVGPSALVLQELESLIISNIQQKQKSSSIVQSHKAGARAPSDSKKLKLKELIKKKQLQEERREYISLEVQHVETLEQEIVQQHQEVIELQTNAELQEIQEYEGSLIDYEAFTAPDSKKAIVEELHDEPLVESLCDLLRQELFANLPHAVKYLSPDAAKHLATNLPLFVSLNKENLPHGFILKQTKEGEFVLDYDCFIENDQAGAFTPELCDIERESIYDISWPGHQTPPQWLVQAESQALLAYFGFSERPQEGSLNQMTNIWIKQGDEGSAWFLAQLTRSTNAQPELLAFLLTHYLKFIPQWEHVYKETFFTLLERVTRYDEEKLTCFKKFLEHTGSSCHDLSRTVAGFEVFWSELSLLCAEHEVAISAINSSSWSTPMGGNPIVYMERLLFILQNARSFKEQMELLDEITLENYAAYYAVRYEDFKVVSTQMQLDYHPKQCDALTFNKDLKLHRVELGYISEALAELGAHRNFTPQYRTCWLVDCSNELPERSNLKQLQEDGLVIPYESDRFTSPYQVYEEYPPGHLRLYCRVKPKISPEVFYAVILKFIAVHAQALPISLILASRLTPRYDNCGWLSIIVLLTFYERSLSEAQLTQLQSKLDKRDKYVSDSIIKKIIELYQRGITFDLDEGLMLTHTEYSETGSTISLTEKLVELIEKNKLALFKLWNFLKIEHEFENGPAPLYQQTIDTAEYLGEDPAISLAYSDDLLLFSRLLMGEIRESRHDSVDGETYDHERQERAAAFIHSLEVPPMDEEVLKYRNEIERYVEKAISQGKSNNLYYLLHKIAWRTAPDIDLSQLLPLCEKVDKIPELAIDTVITYISEVYDEVREEMVPNAIQRWIRNALLDSYFVQIKPFLDKAAEERSPSNLRYIIRKMLGHPRVFRVGSFLEVCLAVDRLSSFSPNKMKDIFYKYCLRDSCAHNAYIDRYLDGRQEVRSWINRTFFDPLIEEGMVKIKAHLHAAATQEKPNNLHYAIQIMLDARQYFCFEYFIGACDEIALLPAFDSRAVEKILRGYEFSLKSKVPKVFSQEENPVLKTAMIFLLIQLQALRKKEALVILSEEGEQPFKLNEEQSSRYEELADLSMTELQAQFQQAWAQSGSLLSVTGKLFLAKIIGMMKEQAIKAVFGESEVQGLLKVAAGKIRHLPEIKKCNDFDQLNQITNNIETLGNLFKQILNNPYVAKEEEAFVALFAALDLSKWDYETLYSLLSLCNAMPHKNYLPLLSALCANAKLMANKGRVIVLCQLLDTLNQGHFSSEYLLAFSALFLHNQTQEWTLDLNKLTELYKKDPKDPVLALVMNHPQLTCVQVEQLLMLSEGLEQHRDHFSAFITQLISSKSLDSLMAALALQPEQKRRILDILSQGHTLGSTSQQAIDYTELTVLLAQLPADDLEQLHVFYEMTPVSAACLNHALKKPERPQDFREFLIAFEKEPFGERALQQQFSLHEVERVINHSGDLLNGSAYSYQHRKQWMEAFLFLNAIGEHLPVYYNQPAKDLTNADIKTFFADLKAKKVPGLTLFQSQLLALGLIREAMYRSTGEFPYSTQMIALIDGMLHLSDFISNIDTGQGKSLIDSMKAALLWLDSDRVDLTTSSIVDAQRDITNYGLFFQRLGIPYSKQPICSSTSMEIFQPKGINFSTFAQLSLFFAKAKVSGLILDTPECRISLVANESDYLFLDDRVIYRFATADGAGIGYGQEWMYGVINQFVSHPEFIKNESTIDDDIESLKAYLKQKARELNYSAKIIDKFSNEYYVSLLESALIVNYALKENEDFVIPEGFEKKIIHGREVSSRVVKVLMGDDKVSPDSSFGNGIQQLLYARLNKERGSEEFIIEPQNRTIISMNNTSLIHYYRAHKGFIWGSSGTVGSPEELQQQHQKYGFEFSKAEPHQTNRVCYKKPVVKANEAQQFNYLIAQLTAGKPQDNLAPSVVFCKDINTATRFFKELGKRNPKQFPVQLYTGLGQEEDFIREARRPGMITVTTSALGRNTNICYDKTKGLRVWHTFIDSIRSGKQKSGRTGRQGSKGWVNFILNAKELHGKTIEQIQDDIERANALDRSTLEVLYNVLGYLLNHITTLPDEQFIHGKSVFLRKVWSEYSKEIEAVFKESRREAHYNPDVFMQFALSSLQKSVNSSITSPLVIDLASMKQALEPTQLEKKRYIPFPEEVKMQDCVPPITIAYQLLPHTGEPLDLGDIKKELKELFHELNTHNFAQKNGIYLRYLAAHPAKQEKIAAAHQEFLKDYLGKQLDKTTFAQRWLGYESLLQKTAGNLSYLLMFHTFAQVSAQPVVTTELMKQAVNKLLDDYLETSWFINTSRKEWVRVLKEKINQVNESNDIISLLSQAQIDVAKNDIQENKKRVLKPLHFFGHSRYQSTLNKALSLATSLSGHTNLSQLTSGLSAITGLPETELCIDKAQEKWIDSRKIDRSNGSVLKETVRNMHFITGRQYKAGMLGRHALQEDVLEPGASGCRKTHEIK